MELTVAGIAVIAFIVGLRIFASRRLLQGRGWAVWLLFAPLLLAGLMVVAFGVSALVRGQALLALVLLFIGVPQAIGVTVMSRRAARDVGAATTPDGRLDAMLTQWSGYQVALTAIVLVGALIAVALLVAYGIGLAAR